MSERFEPGQPNQDADSDRLPTEPRDTTVDQEENRASLSGRDPVEIEKEKTERLADWETSRREQTPAEVENMTPEEAVRKIKELRVKIQGEQEKS